ncbi:MAG: membrane protein insertase YidC [Deltaproteobacteria bacterium]|nr:membrane protein insertase YidC [Deltaproteobacteria bacterium]
MKTEHRTLLAVVISVIFFILWYTVINPQKTPEATSKNDTVAKTETSDKADETIKTEKEAPEANREVLASTSADPQSDLPVKTWSIQNDLIKANFTSDGGNPVNWLTKKYHTKTDPQSPLIDLVKSGNGVVPALALSFEDADFQFPENPKYEMVSADESHVSYRWRSKDVEVVKTVKINPKSYLAEVSASVKNLSNKTLKGKPTLKWGGKNLPAKGGGLLGFMKQPQIDSASPVYFMDGEAHREKSVAKMGTLNENVGSVYWSGLESRYFFSAIIPRTQAMGIAAEYGAKALQGEEPGTVGVWAGVSMPSVVIPIGDTEITNFSVYVGPKEISQLKAVGVNLEKSIDYGWFTIISVPILYLLHFFYNIIHNYGVAIILMTMFVKLLLHPINAKSLKSMKAMQQVQPQLKELQKKYKDDKQRLNQETMALFKAHKVNPMGGCLPMLAQFPIYIALYKVLWNSIELFHAPFFWFYKDLSAPDPYYITPVLLGLFMVAQQKLMPSTSADPAQKKMMMIMPVMFSVFMLFLPVGLVVYILVNTVMSVTQQYLYNKGIRMRDLIRGKWLPSSV